MCDILWIKHIHTQTHNRTYRFAFNPFCGQGTWSDCWSATKRFEPGIHDLSLLINLNLLIQNTPGHVHKHTKTNTQKTNSKMLKFSIPEVSWHPHRQELLLNQSPHSSPSYPESQHFLGFHNDPPPSKYSSGTNRLINDNSKLRNVHGGGAVG